MVWSNCEESLGGDSRLELGQDDTQPQYNSLQVRIDLVIAVL
jgi:hypothetical protein